MIGTYHLYRLKLINYIVLFERLSTMLLSQSIVIYFFLDEAIKLGFISLFLIIWLLFGDVLFLFVDTFSSFFKNKRKGKREIMQVMNTEISIYNIIKNKPRLFFFLIGYFYFIFCSIWLILKVENRDMIDLLLLLLLLFFGFSTHILALFNYLTILSMLRNNGHK